MSFILDALKRGRSQRHDMPGQAGQADAVLHTLTYRRARPRGSSTAGRTAVYVIGALLLAVFIWSAVVWVTSAFLSRTRTDVPAARRTPPPARAVRTEPAVPAASAGRAAADAPPAPAAQPAAAPPATPVVQPESAGRDLFQRGLNAQRNGDFDAALSAYQGATGRDALNVEAYNNMGLLYRDRGLFVEAERALQRAVLIDPRYAPARNNLGLVYLNQKKLEAAASAFHAALSIDPSSVDAMVNLALVERESGRHEAARRTLRDAIGLDPVHPGARYNLGLLEDEAGRRADAVSHYRTFLRHGADVYQTLAAGVRRRVVELESVR